MRFGFIGFILVALLIGGVGLIAYDAGTSSGAAEAAIADGATVVYRPAAVSPFGAIFGFFFLFLLIGFVMKAFAFRRWSGGGAGPWGRHGATGHAWHHDDVPERFRPMLDGWHRRWHDGRDEAGDGAAATAASPRAEHPGPAARPNAPAAPSADAPAPPATPAPQATLTAAAPPRGAWTWDPSAPPAGAWTWDPTATPPPPPAGPPGPAPGGPATDPRR